MIFVPSQAPPRSDAWTSAAAGCCSASCCPHTAKMRLKKHIESLKGGPDYKGHKKKMPGKIDRSHKGGPVRSIRDPPKKLHGRQIV